MRCPLLFLRNFKKKYKCLQKTHSYSFVISAINYKLLLHYGSTNPMIRMYILMLDTRNEEQMNDVRMYIEEYLF